MIWQTQQWGKMLEKSNQVDKIIQVDSIFIEKRSIWLWQFWLFILWIENNIDINTAKKLQEIATRENCLFVQIETNTYSQESLQVEWFSSWYFKKFITPYTAIIDLEMSEDEILAHMKPKGRYNIKVAKKKEIVVKNVEKTDENISAYFQIMNETTSRDNFSGNTLEYYKVFLESLDSSKLFLAYKDDVVVAGGIFVFDWPLAIYYYWASTSKKEYRNMMAPYLLQWSAIQYAKSQNCKIYDFLWVAWENEIDSSLHGVTDFKLKLSKNRVFVSSSFIWINKRFHYTMLVFIKKLKKILKK